MIVAIDPGIDGAAVALNLARGFVDVIDLPTIHTGKRREINDLEFFRWLCVTKPHRIVMENVHSMPKEGVSSVFRFGVAVGMLKSASRIYLGLHALELVDPTVWKPYFDLPGGDKEAARQLALKLFPEMAAALARKLDHQRAEAMLIAWWANRPPVGRNW
jgi:crossover junction endodeoxyribonuclease RuvC